MLIVWDLRSYCLEQWLPTLGSPAVLGLLVMIKEHLCYPVLQTTNLGYSSPRRAVFPPNFHTTLLRWLQAGLQLGGRRRGICPRWHTRRGHQNVKIVCVLCTILGPLPGGGGGTESILPQATQPVVVALVPGTTKHFLTWKNNCLTVALFFIYSISESLLLPKLVQCLR